MAKSRIRRLKEKIIAIITISIWFFVLTYYWTKDITVQKFRL
ncbi:MAG: hypothetical protein OH333_01265 [Candidatus Parvarchaeota archaeon]|nr:hypothetical protein [Candidatus Jingweiarchaeum tengchongense]MCW1310394.1 hypothetical protein [Candidatus Jingweiarchaeum tengchongense]